MVEGQLKIWPGSCRVCKFCCYLWSTGSVTLREDLAALTELCLIIESWFHPRGFPLAAVYMYRVSGNMQNGSTHWRPPMYVFTLRWCTIHGTSPRIVSIIVLALRQIQKNNSESSSFRNRPICFGRSKEPGQQNFLTFSETVKLHVK